ncbi:MAG: glycosyltransferase [Eubacteriales bacterium]
MVIDMNLVDVVIPTYRPDDALGILLQRLHQQTVPIGRIILLHTEVEGEQPLKVQLSACQMEYSNVEIYTHNQVEFDHGATRHKGMKLSSAPYVLYMTQDAVPDHAQMVASLLEAVKQDDVAIAYARQLPNHNATILEKITRQFNYGKVSRIKTEEDISALGIKTFFCSNVCALYDREVYVSLGGFLKKAIFNEDMIYASKVIRSHYKIAYVAEARVIHSHNYTNKQQMQRNFDLGVSQAMNQDVFAGISSSKEGVKLILATRKILINQGYRRKVIPMYLTSAYKWIGYQLGKRYKWLPEALILNLTMNQGYWRK